MPYKVLSEFWCWYGDVVKTVSRFTDDEHEQAALDEVGEHSFDGLPLPSLDAKFYICGKEFEVRDALSLTIILLVPPPGEGVLPFRFLIRTHALR